MVNVARHSVLFLEILYRPKVVSMIKFRDNKVSVLMYGAQFVFTGIVCLFLFEGVPLPLWGKFYVSFVFGSEIILSTIFFLLFERIFLARSVKLFVDRSIGIYRASGIFSVMYGTLITTMAILAEIAQYTSFNLILYVSIDIFLIYYICLYVGPQMIRAFYDVGFFKITLCVFASLAGGGLTALIFLAVLNII